MAHYSYFVLTNSIGTLSKRFRVVMPGYEISLEKAQSVGHTLDGEIDVSMGGVYETHNYIIRVRQEEDDDGYSEGYGNLEDLKTFYRLNNPNGSPSNVITLTDHYGVDYNVYMTGTFKQALLGVMIEGHDAWFTCTKYIYFLRFYTGEFVMRKVEHGVTPEVTNAVTLSRSTSSTGRLTIYKSRVYFDISSDTYVDRKPAFAKAIGYTGYPLAEAVYYNETIEKVITVTVGATGKLNLLIDDTATPLIPTIAAAQISVDPKTRPGIYGNAIFYYVTGTGWIRSEIDPVDVDAGTADCLSNTTTFSTLPRGAIYPVSETEAVILYIDEGSVRIVYVNAAEHECPGRFVNPTVVLDDATDDDFYTLHYAGAVKKSGVVYIYFTTHYGSVKVVQYTFATDNENGTWSDQLVAIPEDLSVFQIGNIILIGDRIFICGMFARSEEYDTNVNYTLMSWSDDGINFSLDRRTLVTSVDLRFSAVMAGNYLVNIATNRFNKELAPYKYVSENAPSTVIKLKSISGGSQSGWSVDVKSGNEEYIDNPYLDTGAFSKLEIGIQTTNGLEWVKYHDTVVSSVAKGWRDGERTLKMQILPDGLWHISSMTHPYYMVVQGKQSHYDPLTDMHNMYKESAGNGPVWSLTSDFWIEDGVGIGWQTHGESTTTDHWGKDLIDYCVEYPVLDDSATIEMRIFGWSRAGIPSTNETHRQVVDSTPTNTTNDDFYALLLVEDENGNQTTIISTAGELASTYKNPPQTYFAAGARAGSLPVVYNVTNPGEGYKIIQVGVRVISGATGHTTYYLERVELPHIGVQLSPIGLNPEVVVAETKSAVGTFNVSGGTYPPPGLPQTGVISASYIKGPYTGTTEYITSVDVSVPNDGYTRRIKSVVRLLFYENDPVYIGECWADHNHIDPTIDGTQYDIACVRIVDIPPGGHELYDCGFYYPGLYSATYTAYWTFTSMPISVEDGGILEGNYAESVVTSKIKGIPQVYFSSRPYTAWNFDTMLRIKFEGSYSMVGIVGLGSDKSNYLVGYMKNGAYGLAKVRGGVKTTVSEISDASILPGVYYDMRFWHRDGLFGIEYKTETETVWPDRGSQFLYEWTELDEEIAVADDLFHVGLYEFIDPPKFRTTGFRSTGTIIPVMPADIDPTDDTSDFINSFPAVLTGNDGYDVDIEGTIYRYTGKNVFSSSVDFPVGPVQLRNIYEWLSPFNKDVDNSYTYPGGKAVEFTEFRFLPGTTGHDDYEGAIIGSSAGYAWVNDETQWKAWITTAGSVVNLRERSRHYSPTIPEYVASTNEKIYITNGLTGVSLGVPEQTTEAVDVNTGTIEEIQYPEGTFVYLDSDDSITAQGFYATTGDHDQSISSLLDMFCKIAGTEAHFDGDYVNDSETLDNGDELELSNV